jgi:hypothetical protein
MSGSQNGADPAAQLRSEEETLTKILHAKMKRQSCFQEADQESVAYRISEIMVAAKELYTRDLPRLMQEDSEAPEGEMFSDLAGLRMTFFHLRDLITDFDEAFLDAMTHQRDDDADEDGLDDDDEGDEDDAE